jgi:hypothetical protein
MEASIGDRRWKGTSFAGFPQPFQDVRAQYLSYIHNGYQQRYWRKQDVSYRNGLCIGLWRTRVIAYRMAYPIVKTFLDRWYLEILKWTTQCQVSFPYVAQKLNVVPYTFPSRNFPFLHAFEFYHHGE